MSESSSAAGAPQGEPVETSSSGPSAAELVQAEILENDPPTNNWRRLLAAVLLVALSDIAIYRGHGYAGWAALFAAAPLLLGLGAFRPRRMADLWVVGGMLALLAARSLWLGSIPQVFIGVGLLLAFAMTLSGMRPYLVDLIVFGAQTIVSGAIGLFEHASSARRLESARLLRNSLAVVIPLAVALLFGLIFTRANPEIWETFSDNVVWFFSSLGDLLKMYGPWPSEIIFWLFVLWITTGAMRPLIRKALWAESPRDIGGIAKQAGENKPAMLYTAFRNMLIAVIALFAIYLVFEFYTLWTYVIPKGGYSAYAHEGAFWLTVALALATALLSIVFRGSVLGDEREPILRRLAWLWSLENFLLAVAVYHRLLIYVGFNGMTRMRMVGFFGISLVVVGFVLVLRKIATDRDFAWLVSRQCWALAVTVVLYIITPVDVIVMRYNVDRILAGDSAPSVQITEHPISSEGILQLTPLLDCQDSTVAEGVRALLSDRYVEAQRQARRVEDEGWTAFQWSDHLLFERLSEEDSRLRRFQNHQEREEAWEAFKKYAFQWY